MLRTGSKYHYYIVKRCQLLGTESNYSFCPTDLSTHPQPWIPYQILEGLFGMWILVPAEAGPLNAHLLNLKLSHCCGISPTSQGSGIMFETTWKQGTQAQLSYTYKALQRKQTTEKKIKNLMSNFTFCFQLMIHPCRFLGKKTMGP